jgi:hypothetical protein
LITCLSKKKLFHHSNLLLSYKHTLHYFFRKLNSTCFHRFSAANYESILSFFPARQVSEIILDESSKSSENSLIEWLQIDTTNFFPKIQSIREFFGNKSCFQNWFLNLSSTSGLSQIWKIRNAWKLPSTCLKENSDP